MGERTWPLRLEVARLGVGAVAFVGKAWRGQSYRKSEKVVTLSLLRPIAVFYKKYFQDVSREFDEFRVNTHLCKLRRWYL